MIYNQEMTVQRITEKHQIIIKGNSNSSALGYMVLAAKALNFPRENIKRLEGQMQHQFDIKTIIEAEKAYQNF